MSFFGNQQGPTQLTVAKMDVRSYIIIIIKLNDIHKLLFIILLL